MKLGITFFTRGLPFDGQTIHEKALGGAESALYFMARELAGLGNDVQVFCECPRPGEYDGVVYRSVDQYPIYTHVGDTDVLVVSRFATAVVPMLRAGGHALWCHDIATRESAEYLRGSSWKTDWWFVLSEFHRKQYSDMLGLPPSAFMVTRNGYDPDLVGDGGRLERDKRDHKVMYISRPERGLLVLLDMWPQIRKAVPDLELVLCSYEHPAADQQMAPLLAEIDRRVKALEGIRFAGALTKIELYRELLQSKALVYPSTFPEISCIAAIEAMACGTPVVASAYCALKETVGMEPDLRGAPGGILIPGIPGSPEYIAAYIEGLQRLLGSDTSAWMGLSEQGRARAYNHYTWRGIAEEWQQLFEAGLTEKSAAKTWHMIYTEDKLALPPGSTEIEGVLPVAQRVKSEQKKLVESRRGYADAYERLARAVLPNNESHKCPRYDLAAAKMAERLPKEALILDAGCWDGRQAIALSNAHPGWQIDGVDISTTAVKSAKKRAVKHAKHPENLRFYVVENLRGLSGYDAIWAGELFEHVPELEAYLEELHRALKPGGWVFATVPHGPWEFTSWGDNEKKRLPNVHLRSFGERDIYDVFGTQDNLEFHYQEAGFNSRGDMVGNWVLFYQPNGKPVGKYNAARKALRIPRQTLSVCIICGGNEAAGSLHRCLRSIRSVADQLVIGFTDDNPETRRIAEQYRLKDDCYFDLPWLEADGLPDFAAARNQTVDRAVCDWILWIDTDEYVPDGEVGNVGKYLRANCWQGYMIYQRHHAIDIQMEPDLPVRLFRNHCGIRFFGAVHEHPETKINEGIQPVILLSDVNIIHDGYVNEQKRQQRFLRNLPVLRKDRQKYPDRQIGILFWERDLAQAARYRAAVHGQLNAEAAAECAEACKIHEEHFANDGGPLRDHSERWYELACALQQQGITVEVNARIDRGLYPGAARTIRRTMRSAEQAQKIFAEIGRSLFQQGTYVQTFAYEQATPVATVTEAVNG